MKSKIHIGHLKSVLVSILFVITATPFVFAQHEGHGGGGVPSTPTEEKVINYYYACSMHPEIISDTHGACYKCGMNLVRKKVAESKSNRKVYFYCPEHTSFKQAKKGKCPKCGKKLKKQKIFIYD